MLPEKHRKQLRDEFDVKRHTFNGYMCFRTNSPAARMMRRAAIERGALLFTGFNAATLGDFLKVTHNTSPNANCTKYSIGECTEVLIKHATNSARLYVDGKMVINCPDMTEVSWHKVLYCLQLICLNVNNK